MTGTGGHGEPSRNWDPDDYDVAGFTFNLSGNVPPLRLQVRTDAGFDYCVEVLQSGYVDLSTLYTECWGVTGFQYQGEPISSITWNLVPSELAPTAYDFCVSDLEATLIGGCVPQCDGKECGDDGCGGDCGDCSLDGACSPGGLCLDSCAGLCGHEYNVDWSCQCDEECFVAGDCCTDICDTGVCEAFPACL